MSQGLKELAVIRQTWVDSNRANNFETGIKRLLTELYPENAHFIYELLQNAEDARAANIRFTLRSTSLEVEHDGERLFRLEDVKSITSIGDSTKRDEPTSIGKFGVGFKAVFAYTRSPEIHSGDFHFRIKDLVVPESDGVEVLELGPKTLFLFPFDHSVKSASHAVGDISRGLRTLLDNTLLFLTHIETIEYTLPDGGSGFLKRIANSENQIEIKTKRPGEGEKSSYWLRFMEQVPVNNGDSRSHNIAVAYAMERDAKPGEPNGRITVVPGQVSIYFPAFNEVSNLKFHLHAPFASTVARDCVRDCDENDQLCDGLAQLVVKSLEQIRDLKLLTTTFLAVLPNSKDRIPSRFEPIQSAIVLAFKNQPLTPTKSGKHAAASTLLRGPHAIQQLFTDDDLKVLGISKHRDIWAANPPQLNQREDDFLTSLGITRWGDNELYEYLFDCGKLNSSKLRSFLINRNEEWMRRFYEVLYRNYVRYAELSRTTLDNLKLIRVDSDKGKSQVCSSEAFFPSEEGIERPREICFVSPAAYSSGKKNSVKGEARLFLEAIGVRTFDETARVEKLLLTYREDSPDDSEHLEHLRYFVRLHVARKVDHKIFASRKFLKRKTTDASGQHRWATPSRVCIDFSSYPTGLATVSHIHSAQPLWEGYPQHFAGNAFNGLIDFLKSIGCVHKLYVESTSIDNNVHADTLRGSRGYVNDYMTEQDWTIPNLEHYLSKKSVEASRLVWNAMIEAPPGRDRARYKPNKTAAESTNESQLVWHLRYKAWVPTKSGEFRKPSNVAKSELLPDFEYRPQNGMLAAIGFESGVIARTDAYRALQSSAEALGFASLKVAEDVAKLLRESGKTPEEIRLLITPAERPELPVGAVIDPKRRAKGIEDEVNSAEHITSVIREHRVRLHENEAKSRAKVWLRSKYTNPSRQMVCQCCDQVMPFRLPNTDEFYFEAVQFLKDLKQWNNANYLALCPLCSAKYQFAKECDNNETRRLILSNQAPSSSPAVEIPIRLAGETQKLRFVGTHMFDLKNFLKELAK